VAAALQAWLTHPEKKAVLNLVDNYVKTASDQKLHGSAMARASSGHRDIVEAMATEMREVSVVVFHHHTIYRRQ